MNGIDVVYVVDGNRCDLIKVERCFCTIEFAAEDRSCDFHQLIPAIFLY